LKIWVPNDPPPRVGEVKNYLKLVFLTSQTGPLLLPEVVRLNDEGRVNGGSEVLLKDLEDRLDQRPVVNVVKLFSSIASLIRPETKLLHLSLKIGFQPSLIFESKVGAKPSGAPPFWCYHLRIVSGKRFQRSLFFVIKTRAYLSRVSLTSLRLSPNIG